MPYKDKQQALANSKKWRENNKEHVREVGRLRQRKRVDAARLKAQAYLGGKCVGCGVTENLQFDHLDRNLKEFNISSRLAYSWESIQQEVDKCQLLCYDCHEIKSQVNHDHDKLAEGYRVTSVTHSDNQVIVILTK